MSYACVPRSAIKPFPVPLYPGVQCLFVLITRYNWLAYFMPFIAFNTTPSIPVVLSQPFLSLIEFIEKNAKIYDTRLVLLDTPQNIFS